MYWVSQNLPQICTASVYICGILKQMQNRFAVNFGTLSTVHYCTSMIWWDCIMYIMVPILDGNSEIDAHARTYLCYIICLRHLIRSGAAKNRYLSHQKRLSRNKFRICDCSRTKKMIEKQFKLPISFHVCASISGLPSNIIPWFNKDFFMKSWQI